MGQLRTANKRHKRAIVAHFGHRKPVAAPPVETSEVPVEAAS